MRLVVENDACLIYYNLNNSRVYCEKEPQYLEVDADVFRIASFLFIFIQIVSPQVSLK